MTNRAERSRDTSGQPPTPADPGDAEINRTLTAYLMANAVKADTPQEPAIPMPLKKPATQKKSVKRVRSLALAIAQLFALPVFVLLMVCASIHARFHLKKAQ